MRDNPYRLNPSKELIQSYIDQYLSDNVELSQQASLILRHWRFEANADAVLELRKKMRARINLPSTRINEKPKLYFLKGLYYCQVEINEAQIKKAWGAFNNALEFGGSVLGEVNWGIGRIYERINQLEKAERFYQIAASLSDTDGITSLGLLLASQKNFNDAKLHYEKAAALNNPSAIELLFDLTQDFDLALKGAKLGYPRLMYRYGLTRMSVEKQMGLAWMREAANAGNNSAIFYLEQEQKSASLLQLSEYINQFFNSSSTDAAAACEIGRLYLQGRSIEKNLSPTEVITEWINTPDDQKAKKWFIRAKDLGNPVAIRCLGWMAYEGRGTAFGRPDFFQSFHWYRLAADLGDVESMERVGQMYKRACGTMLATPNFARAIFYFEKAIENNYEPALENLQNMYGMRWGTDKKTVENLLKIPEFWGRLIQNKPISEETFSLLNQYKDLLIEKIKTEEVNMVKVWSEDHILRKLLTIRLDSQVPNYRLVGANRPLLQKSDTTSKNDTSTRSVELS